MKAVNDAHELEYKVKPEVVAKAPGRFHLIGEHSWFFKDKTLSMAVNLPVFVAISKRADSTLKFYFHQSDDRKKTTLTALKYKKEDKWANSVKAIVYGYQSAGIPLSGMDITVYSQIQPSAGFGITSAIKAATAIAIRRLFNLNLTDNEILQVLERGNRNFLSVENYLANNFTALFSKKDNLIITNHYTNIWDYVPMNFKDKKIILLDTKVPRIKAWSEDEIFHPEYALVLGDLREIRNNVYGSWRYINNIDDINLALSIAPEATRHKLKAIIKEHDSILNAREGLINSDFFKFARAVNESYITMRDVLNSSCPEIDWLIKRVNELEPNLVTTRNPVTCGRITGKGFGRCLYAFIRESDVEKFKQNIADFEKIFSFHPDYYEVEPADGASILID